MLAPEKLLDKLLNMQDKHLFNCPCCGLPTLNERSVFEICTVCWWEDDGQDDDNAEHVLGGPNGKYSLSTARKNFILHGHMYNKGEGIRVVENPTIERSKLVKFVFREVAGHAQFDRRQFYKLLIASDNSRRD